MLPELTSGCLKIVTPAGERVMIGGGHPGLHAQVTIHSWKLLFRLIGAEILVSPNLHRRRMVLARSGHGAEPCRTIVGACTTGNFAEAKSDPTN
jgi:hypothetical protein